jgi:hypothetical protein
LKGLLNQLNQQPQAQSTPKASAKHRFALAIAAGTKSLTKAGELSRKARPKGKRHKPPKSSKRGLLKLAHGFLSIFTYVKIKKPLLCCEGEAFV